jgi:hypothetical protein
MYNNACSKAADATSMSISVQEKIKATDFTACNKVFSGVPVTKEEILACNKSIGASSVQDVSAKADIANKEDLFQKYMMNESFQLVGKQTIYTIGAGAYLYNVYQQRKVTIDIPNLGICDSLHTDLSLSSYTLQLKWSFK